MKRNNIVLQHPLKRKLGDGIRKYNEIKGNYLNQTQILIINN